MYCLKKTISQKLLLSSLVLVMTTGISACHHESPLKKEVKGKSAAFLVSASRFAEKALKLSLHEDDFGAIYSDCMEGKSGAGERVIKVDCKALYKAMAVFAKKGIYPEFKGVTLADITDADMYDGLRDRYDEAWLAGDFRE